MRIVDGDLIELALAGEFDVIVHGCNCHCTMGAGIAKSIKARFPEAYAADLATPKGDRAKLGTISFAAIQRAPRSLVVVNAYTQYDWRGPGKKVDDDAVRTAMQQVKRTFGGKRIGYPLIGAGLAGGDWNAIAPIIDEAWTAKTIPSCATLPDALPHRHLTCSSSPTSKAPPPPSRS